MKRKFCSIIASAVTLFLILAAPSDARDGDLSLQTLECGPNAQSDFVRSTTNFGLGESDKAVVFKITGSSNSEQRAGFLAKVLDARPDEHIKNVYMNFSFKGSAAQLNDCVFELLLRANDGPGGQPTTTFTRTFTLAQIAGADIANNSRTLILNYEHLKGSDPDARLVEMACYVRGNNPIEGKINVFAIRAVKNTVFIPSQLKLKDAGCNALPLK